MYISISIWYRSSVCVYIYVCVCVGLCTLFGKYTTMYLWICILSVSGSVVYGMSGRLVGGLWKCMLVYDFGFR